MDERRGLYAHVTTHVASRPYLTSTSANEWHRQELGLPSHTERSRPYDPEGTRAGDINWWWKSNLDPNVKIVTPPNASRRHGMFEKIRMWFRPDATAWDRRTRQSAPEAHLRYASEIYDVFTQNPTNPDAVKGYVAFDAPTWAKVQRQLHPYKRPVMKPPQASHPFQPESLRIQAPSFIELTLPPTPPPAGASSPSTASPAHQRRRLTSPEGTWMHPTLRLSVPSHVAFTRPATPPPGRPAPNSPTRHFRPT